MNAFLKRKTSDGIIALEGSEIKIYRGSGKKYFAVCLDKIVEIRDCVCDLAQYITKSDAIKASGCDKWCKRARKQQESMQADANKKAFDDMRAWKNQMEELGCAVYSGMFSCFEITEIKAMREKNARIVIETDAKLLNDFTTLSRNCNFDAEETLRFLLWSASKLGYDPRQYVPRGTVSKGGPNG